MENRKYADVGQSEIPVLQKISAEKETVNIAGVGEFFILTPPPGSETVDVSHVIDDAHYTGPKEFPFIVASYAYANLRRELAPEERWRKKRKPPEVRILVFEDSHQHYILNNFSTLGQAANFFYDPREKSHKKDWQRQYRQATGWLLNDLLREVDLRDKNLVLIPIVRAGLRLTELGKLPGSISIEEKRFGLLDDKDVLCVGITQETFGVLDGRLTDRTIVPLEVIQASGSTLVTLLFALREKKINPTGVKVVALVGVQQGVQLYLEAARALVFPTEVILGTAGFALNDKWYAVGANEDRLSQLIQGKVGGKSLNDTQLVGDAGDILTVAESPPAS